MRKFGRNNCLGTLDFSNPVLTHRGTQRDCTGGGLTSQEERSPCPAAGGQEERRSGLSGSRASLGLSGRGGPVGLCPQVSLSVSTASSLGLCTFPSAPTPFPRLLNPRPPRPRGHLQVHGGQLHPDPGGGHLHDGRGDSWAPNSGTNFPAPPVTLRQHQPWLGGEPREANSRGHVTAAGC